MRLYLLPLSTKRTLLHAQRLNVLTTSNNRGLVDKVVDKAAVKWSEWEKLDGGWQRKVVNWGNQAFRRIPYEEWGLKSVPPLSARRKAEELRGKEKVQVVFPRTVIPVEKAEAILKTLATEREAVHRSRLIWCFIGMPLTIPVGILPVIPNLPFFYLVYRAWSHWRAIQGGRHIQWLIKNRLILEAPSETLDGLYSRDGALQIDEKPEKERLLITQNKGEQIATALDLPALNIEMERAVWQVNEKLRKDEEDASAAQPKTEAKDEDRKDQ